MALTSHDINRIRWAVRHTKLGEERILQQAVYIAQNDSVEWQTIQEAVFPCEEFEPKS